MIDKEAMAGILGGGVNFKNLAGRMGMLNSQRPDSERTLPSPGSTAYERMSDEQKAAVDAERTRRTHQYNYESKYNAGAHSYGTNPLDVFNNPGDYTEEQRKEAAMHAMTMNEAEGQDPFSTNTRWSEFGSVTPEEFEAYKQRQGEYSAAYSNPYASDDVRWSSGFEGGYNFAQTPGQSNWNNYGGGLGFSGDNKPAGYRPPSQGGNSGPVSGSPGYGAGGGANVGAGVDGAQGGSGGSSGGSYESQVKSSTPFMDAYLRTRNAAKSEGPVTGMFKDEM